MSLKVYISADMEGITGVTHWNEVDPEKPNYAQFQKRMTGEVVSACRGALDAGAKKIMVKDAHYTGRNILPEDLPEEVELIRGWSGHPYSMVQELDETFDALMMVGYHSRAGSGGNPLSHTMSSGKIERIFSMARFLRFAPSAKYAFPTNLLDCIFKPIGLQPMSVANALSGRY